MLRTIYKLISHFYPQSFRQEFSEEILVDLADLTDDFSRMNTLQKISLIRREVCGWVGSIIKEQIDRIKIGLSHFLDNCINLIVNRMEVDMTESKKISLGWMIHEKKDALLASLPPFLLGTSVSVTWLVIGGPWYTTTETRLRIGLAAGLLVAAVIALGGILALIRRFPVWGYTWLGTDVIGFVLLVKGLTEDQPYLIPEWVSMTVAGILMVFCAVVLITAVLKSWQAAGLVSIGMSTCMALTNIHLMAIGPFHRVDLAFLGITLGLLLTVLTYIYTQTSTRIQLIIFIGIGLINVGVLWLANNVWSVELTELGKPSPFVPMVIILLILLAAGWVLGIFNKPIKRILNK